MTSPASQQNVTAPTSSSNSTVASYASAAGANTKAAATPVIATDLVSPVASKSTAASQHARNSSVSPMNGSKQNIMPAIPTAPAVVHGSSNMNGHDRKSSVNLPPSAPSSYVNGGPVGGTKPNIQFGFTESPAVAHSTPQHMESAPMQIPGAGNAHRVPSPATSPSPIPAPSASGGRPPSTISQDPSNMKFGSLGGESDRHMKHLHTASQSSIPASPSMRRESTNSQHSEMGNHGRGGFTPQGGRGRGNYPNQHFGNQPMSYNRQYPQGPAGQGRGGMPSYNARNSMPPYNTNSPRASPAMAHAMPAGGPPSMGMQQPYSYQPQMPYQQPMNHMGPQNYGPYPNSQYDSMRGPPMMYGGYNPQMPPQFMQHPQNQSPSPAYQAPFTSGQYPPPGPQPMSRNSSQLSERPPSSTSQAQAPVVVSSGTPQLSAAHPKFTGTPGSTGSFVKPKKKSAAIPIKSMNGDVLDPKSLKTPTSPAPHPQPSKTPPVVASTPTPPPKPTTPAHSRSESAVTKTAEQLRKEFQEQVLSKSRNQEETQKPAEQAAEEPAEKPVEKPVEKPAEKPAEKPVETPAEPAKTPSEPQQPSEKTEEPAAVESKAEAPADAKPAAATENEAPADEEDEMERMIREMEEEDARREAEQAKKSEEINARKAAQKEKEKQQAAKEGSLASDADLKAAEREMERLEEERERKQHERETGGDNNVSVSDALKAKISDLKDKPASADSITSKLADLKISGKEGATTAPGDASGKASSEKRTNKPSALNLAPLKTNSVEPPQPSAALQSLKTARFLNVIDDKLYPAGISSPNPALNAAVSKKGSFKYDTSFLMQFKGVFTEKPSLDFEKKLKELMGESDGSRSARTPGPGSSRQGSRAGQGFPLGGPIGSGAISQFAPKTLPPGTTSAERFAMSQGTMARPVGQVGSFPRGFPGSGPMGRQPSSSNMGMPNSPRQGSRSTRGSKRHDFKDTKAEAQAAKAMPLTAGMDLKPITTSSSGWKPTSLTNKSGPPAGGAAGHVYMDPPTVQRKVKAALNKMTPEKFDKISDQILVIAMQSKDEEDGRTLRQVIQLTFEKATDEAHWASMYAKFCRRMLEMMSPEIRDTKVTDKNGNIVSGGALFRKYLLNRCQEEFERGWKLDLPKPPEGESKEAALMSDEYYLAAAAKRRGLGLVQFIGELFKLNMLTERIMHQCITKLVDYQDTPDEAEIESLCKLLRTVGASLDMVTEKGGEHSRNLMNAYFDRIQNMAALEDLPSRLQFMLMDVMDLRKAHWISKDTDKGPKTLEEVRADAEAAAAQKAAEAARSSQRGPGGRMPMGRGDARQFSNYQQQPSNQVGMDDLRRLKGSAGRTPSSNLILGPTSMFASRSNSGRRGLGPGGSLGRAGEESGASSRTGTPPTRESSNAFHVLASMGEPENPASPPSTAASPALAKVVPESAAAGGEKKESG